VRNIGNDGSGRHSAETDDFYVELATSYVNVGGIQIEENFYARSIVTKYLMSIKVHWLLIIGFKFRNTVSKLFSKIYVKKVE
jgi:hypothetical protein